MERIFIDYKEMMHDAQLELEHEQERLSEKMDRVNGSCGHFEWWFVPQNSLMDILGGGR